MDTNFRLLSVDELKFYSFAGYSEADIELARRAENKNRFAKPLTQTCFTPSQAKALKMLIG